MALLDRFCWLKASPSEFSKHAPQCRPWSRTSTHGPRNEESARQEQHISQRQCRELRSHSEPKQTLPRGKRARNLTLHNEQCSKKLECCKNLTHFIRGMRDRRSSLAHRPASSDARTLSALTDDLRGSGCRLTALEELIHKNSE